ncbi:MAG: Flp pilus assembly protein CpaB [Gemmataceae bacterium]|nr:Flp pilus assembly protein CpaB [Gemmataceae bacterium]
MRASTLFALTAAVLIGLGVAVAAKMGGYFNRGQDNAQVKKIETQVLVAARNIYAGDAIDATGIRLRPMKESELKAFETNPKDFLPPVPAAAYLRVAKENIEADMPITRDKLKEMAKPAPLNERLLPDHRAINITLPKERSAGGLIQVGEWVEVYLTSTIDSSDGGRTTRTAALVPKCRLIAKRETLWPVFAPLPKDKPVEYTLEMNSFRAQLFEFSRTKGTISIAPLPQDEQKKLEAERNRKLEGKAEPAMVAEGEAQEMMLAQATERGEVPVTEDDLVKLFDIRRELPPPPPATVKVERVVGTRRAGVAEFTLDGKPYYDGGNTGFDGRGGNRYPGYPYSSNVNLSDGKMIPNNWIMNYGGLGAVGSGTYRGSNMSGNTYRFNQPDCPTCKKNKF